MAIKLEDQINQVSLCLNIAQKDVEDSITLEEEKVNRENFNFWHSILESLNNYKQLKESVKTLS